MVVRRKSFVGLFTLLPALVLLHAMFAEATSRAYPLQIKVLSSEFHSLGSPTPVPKNCDLQNFDAYCNESRNPTVQNVMVVQGTDGKSFTIACTVDSRWSRCAPLPVGETFDARKDKHGVTVLFRNAKGKETKQVYQVLASDAAPQSDLSAQPPTPPAQNQPTPTPATPLQHQAPPENLGQVRCNFASSPSGAEITLDAKYVGSTPSQIAVSVGTHVVIFSMPGFTQWKRDLTVTAGSELTVSATLQKQQQ